jgi:hypothetical protein
MRPGLRSGTTWGWYVLEGAEEALSSIQAEREHPRRTGQGEHPLKTGREVVAARRKHKARNREKTEGRS